MPAGDHNGVAGHSRSRFKRPTTLRIRTKLALMLLIPLLALTGIASVRLADSAQEAASAARIFDMVQLNGDITNVIRALQHERSQAAIQVYRQDMDLSSSTGGLEEAVASSDAFLETLRSTREDFTADDEIIALLELADKPLSRLNVVRDAAEGTLSTVHLTVYNAAVSRLSAVIERSVDLADTADLSRSLRAVSLLTTADESSERLRVLTLELEDGKPLDAAYRPFMALNAARDLALEEYRRISADGHLATTFEYGGLGSQEARPANTFERSVSTSRSNEPMRVDHTALMGAYDARHDATGTVINTLLDQTVERTEVIQDGVFQRVTIEVATVLVTLALAVLIALWLGRSVTLGLRRLRESAHRIATRELPTAVRQVDEHEDLAGLTPEEFADQTTPPLTTQGSDELSEVATAFNQVHREAIRVAAQQAMLRVHIGSMFVRLARRGHSLTGRLTAELDAAEREEQDPDNLARLFRLDHLVSLQARANDSLLVLGGASVAKVRSANASLGDVLKAAQSHIEYYERVNFEIIDDGVWIRANLVDDTVQLLAELMDNATRYSTSPTEVIARFLTDKVVIHIRDRGIGIKPVPLAAYNDRLSTQSPLDLDAFQAMGLTVVGLLAHRNGISVRLRPGSEQGTIAEVVLPLTILEFQSSGQQPQIAQTAAEPPRREAPLFRSDEIPQSPRVEYDSAGRPDYGPPGAPVPAGLPIVHFDTFGPRATTMPPAQPSTDAAGLPHRQPMSNLVPGEISPRPERANKPIRRDPAAIGATYVAYARGVTGDRNSPPPPNIDPRT
ncbi:signal transduction histidine kinase [Stackebrandtia endophytica]|uniref:histidine kinase n=2 Tax=Stackebrandtia endophytica TaxID=1496996 RepID=A0A543AQ92_9ACTN|nr:signal transduction histidine kinase [Stackebrandtia endophytica]